MPLKSGKSKKVVSENFHEFRHGKTFAHTAKKFGKAKARKQMIAAVLSTKRKSK
jgi:hypothetical protein